MPNPETELSRVSIDVPTPFAPAIAAAVEHLGTGYNVTTRPIMEEPSELFTILEEPRKEILIPAVQRPHLRAFARREGLVPLGVAERFIGGLWVRGPSAIHKPKELQWIRMDPTLVLDSLGKVLALRATRTPDLHRMMDTGDVNIMGIGSMTIDFFGQFSEALQEDLVRAGLV